MLKMNDFAKYEGIQVPSANTKSEIMNEIMDSPKLLESPETFTKEALEIEEIQVSGVTLIGQRARTEEEEKTKLSAVPRERPISSSGPDDEVSDNGSLSAPDQIMDSAKVLDKIHSSQSFNKDALDVDEEVQYPVQETVDDPSLYTLQPMQSHLSENVDHWIRGSSHAGVAVIRLPGSPEPLPWYVLALFLPMLSYNNSLPWRCASWYRFLVILYHSDSLLGIPKSTLLGAAEVLLTQLVRVWVATRARLRQMARDESLRDFFATCMDVVLVIYALGFLTLTLYQASVIT